jgi:uncharacterized membrane protein
MSARFAGRPETRTFGWFWPICLAVELLRGLWLTVAVLIIYGDPSLSGLRSFVPLWALLVYVVTNIALVAYGMLLFVLMAKKLSAAIINNIAFNILSAAFVCWHFIGEKSHIGTIADSLPGLIGLAYVSRSRRVRNTFTATRSRSTKSYAAAGRRGDAAASGDRWETDN